MSSPFLRRSASFTAGAVVFTGLIAPVAAFAAEPAGSGALVGTGLPATVTVEADPDGKGDLFTLTEDVTTYTPITMPNDATIDGAGHKITAMEDADNRNFPGSVLASAVGTDSDPAMLDVANLRITTQGFEDGSNSGGQLNGIYMYRAGGSLTNVSVEGISHGNGVQEGNAISIRNRVSGENIDVPRAKVDLTDVRVTNYQKTGLLLDGNLVFTVDNAHVGQGAGPQGHGQPDHCGQLFADLPRRVRFGDRQLVQAQQPRCRDCRAPLQRQEGRFRCSDHQRRCGSHDGHQRVQRFQHHRHHLHDAGWGSNCVRGRPVPAPSACGPTNRRAPSPPPSSILR